ncbi:DUF6471 domain-containing protein [Comamonas testosteroni]
MLKPTAHTKKLAQQQVARLAKERAKERQEAQATGIYKWELEAKARLSRLRQERKVSYKDLSRLLQGQGIDESPSQLNRKVNRLKFSAAFYLACMYVIENVPEPSKPAKNTIRK